MVMALSVEEKKALHLFGVYDCHNAHQLIQQEEAIKRIYRKRALSSHPDRAQFRGFDPVQMVKVFQSVSESYQLLMQRIIHHKKGPQTSSRTVKVRPKNYHKREKTETTSPKKARSVSVGFYMGPVPAKQLRYAEYLYYKKYITWEQLISALSWQFINRPKLGELARERGLLTNNQILTILRAKKSSQRFGLVAVNKGFLSVANCKEILKFQRKAGLPIGKFFVDNSILSSLKLHETLNLFSEHNRQYKG